MVAEAPPETAVTVYEESGNLNVGLNLDLSQHTPAMVIEHLMAEGKIMRTAGDGSPLNYKLAKAGTALIPDQPLGQQGVVKGDRLALLCLNTKGSR